MLRFILALQFLIRLRFPSNESYISTIERRYGQEALRGVRRWERSLCKWEKNKQDIVFLERCLQYGCIPKFVQFKLYRRQLQKKKFYKDWQTFLIENELREKRKVSSKLYEELMCNYNSVKQQISFLDFNHVLHCIHKSCEVYKKRVSLIHSKKLYKLGGFHKPPSCDASKVVYNLANYPLSKREKYLLSFGLDHCLQPRIDNIKLKVCLEVFANKIDKLHRDCCSDKESLFEELRKLFTTVNEEYKREIKVSLFDDNDIKILRNLGKNKNIIISRPDKGKGVTIMKREEYVDKMASILTNPSHFEKCERDPFKATLLLEDKVNRYLSYLKKGNYINNDEYKYLYASGSTPGILYGLPKIHKVNTPLRPVMSSINTHNYKLAKFIIPHIKEWATSEYTLENSYEFFDILKNFRFEQNYYMVSFDINNLYTNVPNKETINIVANKMYTDNNSFRGLSKSKFIELLELVVNDSFFIFNDVYYKQIDGLAMGNPISATLANIFLCFHETQWLNNCPSEFKPLLYRRYVDDTFIIFRERKDALKFFTYLNSQHPNITFTKEEENERKLPFLDILVTKSVNEGLNMQVYRKPTYTGLGLNFLSECSFKYKINNLTNLLFRAFRLSSSYLIFHKEVAFLKSFFNNNGYSDRIFYKNVSKFLNRMMGVG